VQIPGIVNNPQISVPEVILRMNKIRNSLSCKAKTSEMHIHLIISEPLKSYVVTFKNNKAHILSNCRSTNNILGCSTIHARAGTTNCRPASVGITEVN